MCWQFYLTPIGWRGKSNARERQLRQQVGLNRFSLPDAAIAVSAELWLHAAHAGHEPL